VLKHVRRIYGDRLANDGLHDGSDGEGDSDSEFHDE
jgi:hypothetical protein